MTAPSTVCPSCGEDVPFGRRTCEACGASLTAAEAPDETQSDRAPDEAEVVDAPAAAMTDDEGWDSRPGAPVAADRAPGPAPGAAEPAPPVAVEPPATPAPDEPKSNEPEASPFVPPVLREWNAGSPAPQTGFAAELATAEGEPTGLAGAWLPPSAPNTRASSPGPTSEPEPIDWPAAPEAPTWPDAPRTPPNAMPASLAQMLQRPAPGAPRWPGTADGSADLDAGAAGSADPDGSMNPPSRMPDLGPASRLPAAMPPEARRLEPGRSPLLADLPFDAPDTLPGWLVAGGGGLATISFLLPWVAVIDSYFSAWGLGSIANLPVFLVAFGTTVLAVLPSRLADWLRHGILGLAVGSFILGITWNRLVGATGGQLGVILEASGALLLLVGGILAIVRDRGAANGPRERG